MGKVSTPEEKRENQRLATKRYREKYPERSRESNRLSAARGRSLQPEAKRLIANASTHRARARKRALITTAKSKPCIDCKVQYHPYIMDLDHVRGVKIINVSFMVARGYTDAQIIEEIAKCDVVCANCHRERTHARRAQSQN